MCLAFLGNTVNMYTDCAYMFLKRGLYFQETFCTKVLHLLHYITCIYNLHVHLRGCSSTCGCKRLREICVFSR